jgi:hypothetical protein
MGEADFPDDLLAGNRQASREEPNMVDHATKARELKQEQREKETWEHRHVLARLEELADVLESIGGDIKLLMMRLPDMRASN